MIKHFIAILGFISLITLQANAATTWWQAQTGGDFEVIFTTPVNTIHEPGTQATLEGYLHYFDPNTGQTLTVPNDLKQNLRVEFYYPNRSSQISVNLNSNMEFSFQTPVIGADSANVFSIKVIRVNGTLASLYQQETDLKASLAHYQDPNYIDPYKGPIIENLISQLQATTLQILANEQVLTSIDLPIRVAGKLSENLSSSMLFQGFKFEAILNHGISDDNGTVSISSKLTDNRNKYDALIKGSNAAPKWKIEYYLNNALVYTEPTRNLGENVSVPYNYISPSLSFISQNQFKMILYNVDGNKVYKVGAFTVSIPVSEMVASPTPTATPLPTATPTSTPAPIVDQEPPSFSISGVASNFGYIKLAPQIIATITDSASNIDTQSLHVELSGTKVNGDAIMQDITSNFAQSCQGFSCTLTGTFPNIEGELILKFFGSDNKGNAASVFTVHGVLDQTIPEILATTTFPTTLDKPVMNLNISDFSPMTSIVVDFTNGSSCTSVNKIFECKPTLNNGANPYTITATDVAGNTATQAGSLVVDLIPALLSSTLTDHILNSNPVISVPVTITQNNGSTVTTKIFLNGVQVYATTSLQFTAQLALNVGQNVLEIKASKANGLNSVPLLYQDLVYNPKALTAASPNGTTLISPAITIPTTLSQAFIDKTSTATAAAAVLSNRTDTVSCTNGITLTPPTTNLGLSQFDAFTEVTPEITQLANQLQTADQAFYYIRDQIKFLPRFGALQTATQTLNSGVGTAIDKAAALIALYKALGIESRFVFGDVYVEENKLKNLLEVSTTNDLAWAMQLSLRGYFQKLIPVNFEPSQMVSYNQGHRVWQMPHAWVYAKIQTSPNNFEWMQLDPLLTSEDLLVSSTSNYYSSTADLNPQINNYLFAADGAGSTAVYVKYLSFTEWLKRNLLEGFLDYGTRNIGLKNLGLSNSSGYSTLVSQNISDRAACITNVSEELLEKYQFKSTVRIGNVNSPLADFSLPTYKLSKHSLSISHSAGTIADIGSNSVDGYLKFELENQIISTSQNIQTNASFNFYHSIQEPLEYGGATTARETPNLKAGGLHVLTHSIAPKNENDYFNSVGEFIDESKIGVSSNLLLKELKLATFYALYRGAETDRVTNYLVATKRFTENLTIVGSQDGFIAEDSTLTLGYKPSQGYIDWEMAGPIYSKIGGNTNFLNYINIASAKGSIVTSNSSMEHRIWEDLFGIKAVSAVKILQTAGQNNANPNAVHVSGIVNNLSAALLADPNGFFKPAMRSYFPLLAEFTSESPKLYGLADAITVGTWTGVGFFLIPTNPLGHAGAFIGQGGETPTLGGEYYSNCPLQSRNTRFFNHDESNPYAGYINFGYQELGFCSVTQFYALSVGCSGNYTAGMHCSYCHQVMYPVSDAGPNVCTSYDFAAGEQIDLPAEVLASFEKPLDIHIPDVNPPTIDTGEPNSVPPQITAEQNVSGCLAMSTQSCNLTPNNSKISQGACSLGEPVNIESGSMWHEFTDFALKGITAETNLILKRTYFSNPSDHSLNSDFGPNWFHNFETKVFTVSSSLAPTTFGLPSIVLVDDSGGAWTFKRTSVSTGLAAPDGFKGSFTEFLDRYEWITNDGRKYVYYRGNANILAGSLKEINGTHGEKVTLNYNAQGKLDSISAPFAGAFVFTRNAAGKITKVLNQRDNLEINYAYNSDGKLSSSTDFNNLTTTYEYNPNQVGTKANGLLSTITDPIGRKIEFTYYNNGRAYEQTEPGNGYRAFAYSSPTQPDHFTLVKDIDGNATEFRFDSKGQVVQTIYQDGSQTRNLWSGSFGNILRSIDEMGYLTNYGFDARGNQTGISNADGTYSMTYTSQGNVNKLASFAKQGGASTTFSNNTTNGNLNFKTSGGLRVDYTYDSFGNVLSINNTRATYNFGRDSNGLLITVPDSSNPETRDYDAKGRVITRSFASGKVLQYTYDNRDRILRIEDNTGPSVENTYDIMGRILTQKVIPTDSAAPQVTSYVWDERDRLVEKTDALGLKTKYVYDKVAAGCNVVDKPAQVIDSANRITKMEYDKRQRLIRSIDAENRITRYEYNARGDLIALTDPSNNRTVWTYTGSHKPVKRERPSVTIVGGNAVATTEVTNYIYNTANNLTRIEQGLGTTNAVKNVTEFTYNSLERVTRKVLKREQNSTVLSTEDDSNFTYENQLDATLIKTAGNGIANIQFTTEALPPFHKTAFNVAASSSNNPLQLIQGNFGINYGSTGQIESIVDASNNLALYNATYDNAGRMTQIASNYFGSNAYTSVLYDSFGRKRGAVHSTGMMGSFSYDQDNRLTSVYWDGLATQNGASEHFLDQLAYHPQTGNIDQITREFGVQNFSYDNTNQLTGYSFINNNSNPDLNASLLSRTHQYDKTGNRINDSILGTSNFLANTILSDGFYNYSVDSDGRGNRTARTNRQTNEVDSYIYRSDGKETRFENSNWIEEHFFDALGRKVANRFTKKADNSQFIQNYLHSSDQDQILMGKNGNGDLTVYLDGQGVDEHLMEVNSTQSKAYMTDHLGSVVNTDAAGNVHGFSPWGERVDSNPLPILSATTSPVIYGYTGREFSLASNAYYYRARSYDQLSGRFSSQDPIGFNGGDSNLFRYVGNNPMSYIDPNGLWTASINVAIGFSVPGYGISGGTTLNVGYSKERSVSVSITGNKEASVAGGFSLTLGPSIIFSNAQSVKELNGNSSSGALGIGRRYSVGYSPENENNPASYSMGYNFAPPLSINGIPAALTSSISVPIIEFYEGKVSLFGNNESCK